MWWTSHQKRHVVKRWYCRMCDKRTPVELNPEWVLDGRPLKGDGKCVYKWFTRCSVCEFSHYDRSSYDCLNCGCPSLNEPDDDWRDEEYEGTLIQMTKGVMNPRYSMEYGSTGYDWDEQHKCRKCGTKWWFTNSTH